MNDFEQEEQTLLPSENDNVRVPDVEAPNVERESSGEKETLEEDIESTSENAILQADAASPVEMQENEPASSPVLVKRAPRKRLRMGPTKTKRFERFVSIGWSGAREPAADLIWAEASIDGKWIVVDSLERIRTRKEILERILPLQAALVTFDFNFSYPTDFFDLLRETEGIGDWRAMLRAIRVDTKKNVDDGLRLWAERMGRYRESRLDPNVPRGKLQHTRHFDDWGWNSNQKGLAPHEQLSMARRFRNTDIPLRNFAGSDIMSTMQIGYNQLTGRYEFNGNIRGRPALLGMAMLEQLLETKYKELAIWPMMEPRAITIAESLPWLFTEGKLPETNELENVFNNYEDAGWEIPDSVRAYARKNNDARKALFTLIGVVKTEQRLSGRRGHPPIRDYNPAIYHDPRVQLEGWIYGIGYRRPDEEPNSGESHSERGRSMDGAEHGTKTIIAPSLAEPSVAETSIEE
jgi:hypothetical protein